MVPNEPKKISLLQYVITIFAVGILASGVTLFIYEAKTPEPETVAIDTETQDDLENIDLLYQLIKNQYIEDVSEKDLINGALKGMTDAIGDPHSTFFVEEEAQEFDDSISGSFEGIGASMTLENGYPVIAEPPFEDSPAEKANLKKDDIIMKVDDKEVKDQTLSETVSQIKGKKGTSVKLEILRGKETFTVEIVRDTIPVESVKSSIDKTDKTIGYIQIVSFSATTSDEFNEAVTNLRADGAKKFVIDVRGNPGGVLQEVEKMTSRFLKDGETIIGFENKQKEIEEEVAGKKYDAGEKITEPTVILTDENSASASEIMAGALKENGFDVIGVKTYGKGTVQAPIPIEGHGELKITVSKWLLPSGEWIHEKGIEPTIKVDYPDYLKRTVLDQSLTYKEGTIGTQAETINIYLKELGYDITDVSENYTAETSAAIKKFQEKSEIEVTGVTNKETVSKLETAIRDHWKENDTQYNKALEVLQNK